MVLVLHSRVVGPLEPYAQEFAADLARQGYTVGAAGHQLGLAAHLSRWMVGRRLGVEDLTPQVLKRYMRARRVAGYRLFRSEKALVPLLGHLRQLGVAVDPVPLLAQTPAQVALERYRDYLISDRGMVSAAFAGIWIWSARSSSSTCATRVLMGLLLVRSPRSWSASRAGCRRRRCNGWRVRCGRCCVTGSCEV